MTSTELKNTLFQFDIKPGPMAEIEALLSIPTNPFWVLPQIFDIIIRAPLTASYIECVEIFSEEVCFTDSQKMYLLVSPRIREYINGIDPRESDIHYADEIDNLIGFDTPLEKIATQYAIASKGGLYSALAAGSSMYDYTYFEESNLHMPALAIPTLQKAIQKLYSNEGESQLIEIQESKPSILKEARIKLVLSLYECGASVTELIPNVTWIEHFHPNHQRWQTVKQHNDLISQMTNCNLNKTMS
jgi:hypothetical protein